MVYCRERKISGKCIPKFLKGLHRIFLRYFETAADGFDEEGGRAGSPSIDFGDLFLEMFCGFCVGPPGSLIDFLLRTNDLAVLVGYAAIFSPHEQTLWTFFF